MVGPQVWLVDVFIEGHRINTIYIYIYIYICTLGRSYLPHLHSFHGHYIRHADGKHYNLAYLALKDPESSSYWSLNEAHYISLFHLPRTDSFTCPGFK